MKKLLIIFFILSIAVISYSTPTKQASEYIGFWLNEPLDSAFGIERKPDSVHVFTIWDNATAMAFATRSTTFPFTAIGIDTIKHYGDSLYFFSDQIQDIDGSAQLGVLDITVNMWYDDIKTTTMYSVQVISDSLENMLDASKDSSSSAAVLSKNNLDSLQEQDDWVAKEATLAYFDTLMYNGGRGRGIYIDSSVGNTNTVIGVDGTEKNPVSTLVAARTLADALGSQRYYIVNKSTFNSAANDLSSSHLNWEFIGMGHMVEMAFGSQNVTGSRFQNISLSGAMHASGGDVLYEDCFLGFISANYTGHALRCWILDTLVLKNGIDIEFNECVSGVAGNHTPTLDFGAGSTTANIRHYSGGIRIMNANTQDTISIETDGQVIISANNTSLHASLRGNMIVTDSGTTTDLTRDAALSGAYIAATNWALDTTNAFAVAAGVGKFLKDSTQGSASGLTKEDVADAVADTLEAGTRNIVYNSLTIDNQDANDTAVVIRGNGSAPGLWVSGGINGDGAEFVGGATSGRGFYTHAIASNSHGYQSIGFGTGNGANFTSGSGVTGNGVGMTSVATNGNGLKLTGTGAGNGLDITTGIGFGVKITGGYSLTGGATIAGGMTITEGLDVSNSTGDAAQFTSSGSNGDAIQLTGHGSGDGLKSIGGSVGGKGASFSGTGSGNGMNITGGATNGVGLQVNGNGNAHAVTFTGSGVGDGLNIRGGITGDGIEVQGGPTSGAGVRIWANGTNDTGLVVLGIGSGHGISATGGATGVGIKATGGSTSGQGIYALGGTVGDGFLAQGRGGQHGFSAIGQGSGDDIRLNGNGYIASATDTVQMRGDSLINQGAAGSDSSPSGWDATDSSIFMGLVDDTLKKAHQDSDWGATGAGGDGLYTYIVVALDTLGTDSVVSSVKVTVRNTISGDNWSVNTLGNGVSHFSLDSMSYFVLANKTGYIFPTITDTVTGNETDTIRGYNSFVVAVAPSNSNLCNVNGLIYDASYNLIDNAKIFFECEDIVDTCGGVIIPKLLYYTETNDTGYFSKNILKTSCMKGTRTWKVYVKYEDKNGNLFISQEHSFSIPADSTTYRLEF